MPKKKKGSAAGDASGGGKGFTLDWDWSSAGGTAAKRKKMKIGISFDSDGESWKATPTLGAILAAVKKGAKKPWAKTAAKSLSEVEKALADKKDKGEKAKKLVSALLTSVCGSSGSIIESGVADDTVFGLLKVPSAIQTKAGGGSSGDKKGSKKKKRQPSIGAGAAASLGGSATKKKGDSGAKGADGDDEEKKGEEKSEDSSAGAKSDGAAGSAGDAPATEEVPKSSAELYKGTDSSAVRAKIDADADLTPNALREALANERRRNEVLEKENTALKTRIAAIEEGQGDKGTQMAKQKAISEAEATEIEKLRLALQEKERQIEVLEKQMGSDSRVDLSLVRSDTGVSVGSDEADSGGSPGDKADRLLELTKELEAAKKERDDFERKWREQKELAEQATMGVSHLQTFEIGQYNEKHKDLADRYQKLEGQLKEAQAEVVNMTAEKEKVTTLLEKMTAEKERLAPFELESKKHTDEIARLRELTTTLTQEKTDALTKQDELSREIARLNDKVVQVEQAASADHALTAGPVADEENPTVLKQEISVLESKLKATEEALKKHSEETEELKQMVVVSEAKVLDAEHQAFRLQMAAGKDVDVDYKFNYREFSIFNLGSFLIDPRATRHELVKWSTHVANSLQRFHERYSDICEANITRVKLLEDYLDFKGVPLPEESGFHSDLYDVDAEVPLDTMVGGRSPEHMPDHCWPHPHCYMDASVLVGFKPTKKRLLEYIDIMFDAWREELKQTREEYEALMEEAGVDEDIPVYTYDDDAKVDESKADSGDDHQIVLPKPEETGRHGRSQSILPDLKLNMDLAMFNENMESANLSQFYKERAEEMTANCARLTRELRAAKAEAAKAIATHSRNEKSSMSMANLGVGAFHTMLPSSFEGMTEEEKAKVLMGSTSDTVDPSLVRRFEKEYAELEDGRIVINRAKTFINIKSLAFDHFRMMKKVGSLEALHRRAIQQKDLEFRKQMDAKDSMFRKHIKDTAVVKEKLAEREASLKGIQESLAGNLAKQGEVIRGIQERLDAKLEEIKSLQRKIEKLETDAKQKEMSEEGKAVSDKLEMEVKLKDQAMEIERLMDRDSLFNEKMDALRKEFESASESKVELKQSQEKCAELEGKLEFADQEKDEMNRELSRQQAKFDEEREDFELKVKEMTEKLFESQQMAAQAANEAADIAAEAAGKTTVDEGTLQELTMLRKENDRLNDDLLRKDSKHASELTDIKNAKDDTINSMAEEMESMRRMIAVLNGKVPFTKHEKYLMMKPYQWKHRRFDSMESGHFRDISLDSDASEFSVLSERAEGEPAPSGIVGTVYAGAKYAYDTTATAAETAVCRIRGVKTSAEIEAAKKKKEEKLRKRQEAREKRRREKRKRSKVSRSIGGHGRSGSSLRGRADSTGGPRLHPRTGSRGHTSMADLNAASLRASIIASPGLGPSAAPSGGLDREILRAHSRISSIASMTELPPDTVARLTTIDSGMPVVDSPESGLLSMEPEPEVELYQPAGAKRPGLARGMSRPMVSRHGTTISYDDDGAFGGRGSRVRSIGGSRIMSRGGRSSLGVSQSGLHVGFGSGMMADFNEMSSEVDQALMGAAQSRGDMNPEASQSVSEMNTLGMPMAGRQSSLGSGRRGHSRQSTQDLEQKALLLLGDSPGGGDGLSDAFGSFISSMADRRKERKSASRDFGHTLKTITDEDGMDQTLSGSSTIIHPSGRGPPSKLGKDVTTRHLRFDSDTSSMAEGVEGLGVASDEESTEDEEDDDEQGGFGVIRSDGQEYDNFEDEDTSSVGAFMKPSTDHFQTLSEVSLGSFASSSSNSNDGGGKIISAGGVDKPPDL